MLNNEFRLIGTVITDYEKFGTEDFPKYKLTIEVEKKKKGAPAKFEVIIYASNYTLDVTKSVKGKQVIVSGYLDVYNNFNRLIMQDMIFIGEPITETPKEVPTELPPEEKDVNLDALDLPDDDLPF